MTFTTQLPTLKAECKFGLHVIATIVIPANCVASEGHVGLPMAGHWLRPTTRIDLHSSCTVQFTKYGPKSEVREGDSGFLCPKCNGFRRMGLSVSSLRAVTSIVGVIKRKRGHFHNITADDVADHYDHTSKIPSRSMCSAL
jgi:hypothetical protein